MHGDNEKQLYLLHVWLIMQMHDTLEELAADSPPDMSSGTIFSLGTHPSSPTTVENIGLSAGDCAQQPLIKAR